MQDGVAALVRTDMYQFGSVSSRRALVVLPSVGEGVALVSPAPVVKMKGGAAAAARATVPASAVRIVVGDDAGAITCVSIARGGAIEVNYKVSSAGGARIESITLGGKAEARERIFYSAGGSVAALTRKGKEFFSMASSTVEPLRALTHDGARLGAAGGISFTLTGPDGREEVALTLPDRATCLTLARPTASGADAPGEVLIGCADGVIRLVGGGGVTAEVAIEGGSVTALIGWAHSPFKVVQEKAPRFFVYGTASGIVGVITLMPNGGPLTRLFSLLPPQQQQPSGIAALCCVPSNAADATASGAWSFAQGDGSGTGDVAVARDDGTVDIYSLVGGEGLEADFSSVFNSSSSSVPTAPPTRAVLVARGALPEAPRALGAIASVSGGPGCDVIALCFSGRLSLLRASARDNTEAAGDRKAQLVALLSETEVLKTALALRTAENSNKAMVVAKSGQSENVSLLVTSAYFPMAHRLEASHSWSLDAGDVAYTVRSGERERSRERSDSWRASRGFRAAFALCVLTLLALHPFILSPQLTIDLSTPIDHMLVTTTCKVDGPDPESQEIAWLPPAPIITASAAATGIGTDVATLYTALLLPGVISVLPILPQAEAYIGACSPVDNGGGFQGEPRAPAAALAIRVAGTGGGLAPSCIAVRLRPVEGMPGELTALVVSAPEPRTALAITIPILGLSLHERFSGMTS